MGVQQAGVALQHSLQHHCSEEPEVEAGLLPEWPAGRTYPGRPCQTESACITVGGVEFSTAENLSSSLACSPATSAPQALHSHTVFILIGSCSRIYGENPIW